MECIINLFIALIMTDITGTIFYLMGLLFWKIWFQRDVVWKRFCLRIVLAAYSVPVVFGIIYVKRLVQWRGAGELEGFTIFYSTPRVRMILYLMGCLWFTIVIIVLLIKLYRYLGWRKICLGNIPEEDEETQELFDRICGELGLTGKVSLCRNDMISVPCITRCRGAALVLPFVKYTKDRAEVVFYHELCHYAERDMWIKNLTVLIGILHGFNPLVHISTKQVQLVCEESCDRLACKRGESAFSSWRYFQIIFNMMQEGQRMEHYELFLLFDSELDYERRVKCMCNGHGRKHLKKGLAVALSACFLLGSSLTAYAAGDALAGECTGMSWETNEYTSIDMADAEMEQFMIENNLDPSKVTIIPVDEDLLDGVARGMTTFDWQIPAGGTFMSSGFRAHEGDEVGVSATGYPEDIEYRIGLKDPDDIMHYIPATGVMGGRIVIQQDGKHYFFISNMSETQTLDIQASLAK